MISGHNAQRILGCPICGYRVDTKDQTCPRCGSEFYKGTKFECPLCGGLVSSEDKSCPSCRVDYNDFRAKTKVSASDDQIDALLTEIIGIESEQVKKEDKRYSCPVCSWMLDGSESVCPRCNHDLVEDLSFQCPVCGAIVGSNAKACPECGASFEESEEVRQESIPEPPKPKPEPPPQVVRAPEPPPPPPEPPKEVRPIVVVKPPRIVPRPPEVRAPEPVLPDPEPSPEAEPEIPEQTLESVEEALDKMEKELADDAEIERASEQLAVMAQQPQKKSTKKRKLKAKPKA